MEKTMMSLSLNLFNAVILRCGVLLVFITQ